jgi:drug/metabolite transporter (DMT)-like permease
MNFPVPAEKIPPNRTCPKAWTEMKTKGKKAILQTSRRAPAVAGLPILATLFASFLCILFGGNTVAIKISLSGLGVFSVAGIRFSIAAVVIFLWAWCTQQPLRLTRRQLQQLLLIAAIFFIQLSLFIFGLSKTYASRGTLLANIQPFFVLFLAHFFVPGDRISGRKLIGIVLGFSGVVFVFLEQSGGGTELRQGDMIILAAAFVWACNGVYTKNILTELQPFQVVLFQTLIAAPLFLLGAWVSGEFAANRFDPEVVMAILYQGLIATSFGFVAWNTLLQKHGAVALHSFLFLMPVTGVALGGAVLGEPITLQILSALVLIASGILIVNTRLKIPIVHPGRNV